MGMHGLEVVGLGEETGKKMKMDRWVQGAGMRARNQGNKTEGEENVSF